MSDECSIVVTSHRSDITSNHPRSSKQLFQSRGLLICQLYITVYINNCFRPDMRSRIIIEKALDKTLNKGLTNISTITHHSVLYTEAQSTSQYFVV